MEQYPRLLFFRLYMLKQFSYARYISQPAPFNSPRNFLPPEVLLHVGSIDCAVDIWMLACSAYLIATSAPLFSDSYVQSPLKAVEETVPKLEKLLKQNGNVPTADIPVFFKFLQLCLVSDPVKRATVTEHLFENDWVDEAR